MNWVKEIFINRIRKHPTTGKCLECFKSIRVDTDGKVTVVCLECEAELKRRALDDSEGGFNV